MTANLNVECGSKMEEKASEKEMCESLGLCEAGRDYDVCGDGSVVKHVLVAGYGMDRPILGANACVNYVGRFAESKEEFDRGNDFRFTVGEGVIQGWSDVIVSMVKGEKSRVVLQSEKAYGARGSGRIPPNSVLEFDIELLNFSNEKDISVEQDGSVMIRVLKEGVDNWDKPDSLCRMSISYSLFGRVLGSGKEDWELLESHSRENPFSFIVDDPTPEKADKLPKGLDRALKSMCRHQESQLWLSQSVGFAEGPWAGLALRYDDLVVVEMEGAPQVWHMNTSEKLQYAERVKLRANEAFKHGTFSQLDRATRLYAMAVQALEFKGDGEAEDAVVEEQSRKMLATLKLNKSTCFLKMGRAKEALREAKEAHAEEKNNPKSHFRMGCALAKLNELESAVVEFKIALELAPNDGLIMAELKKAQDLIHQQYTAEKKKFKGMFSKLSGFASANRETKSLNESLHDDPFQLPPTEEHAHHHHSGGGCCGHEH